MAEDVGKKPLYLAKKECPPGKGERQGRPKGGGSAPGGEIARTRGEESCVEL